MERERITISIRKQVLGMIDATIDGTSVRNRSHAIESLVMKAIGQEGANNALILLGGDNALKAIPATKIFLSKLKEAGFKEVYIAVGFLGSKVKEKLGDGKEIGIELHYSDRGEGSGGAILAMKKYFKSTFLVINASENTAIDLNFALKYHKKYRALATVITNDLASLDGVYILEPEIFTEIPKDFSMFEENTLPKIIKEGKAVILSLSE